MDSNLGKEEKRNKLKIAIAKQTKVTKENIFGEGVDVPLLGRHSLVLFDCFALVINKLQQMFQLVNPLCVELRSE